MENVIIAVKRFKKSHPYRGSNDERMKKFCSLLKVLSWYYQVDEPTLYIAGIGDNGSTDAYLARVKGFYNQSTNTIGMRIFSVITVLHEFRHLLQYRWSGIHIIDDKEEDANIWSHLIYKVVYPKNYARLVANGELNRTRHNI